MANSKLQGTSIDIPKKVSQHLNKILNAYKGNKTVEGYPRLVELAKKNKISYEQLKRIKNFFDKYDGSNKSTPYLLNGGTLMKQWVNKTLKDARGDIEGKKKSMKDTGMDNQYLKTHTKDNVKIDAHSSETDKILQQEGIYNIGVMEDIIKIIDKNKQLWHTEEHRYHQS